MIKKLIKETMKLRMLKFGLAILTVSSIFPLKSVSALNTNDYVTNCSMTINASKNINDNFANASGECKEEIYGYYSPSAKVFRVTGAYTGQVKDGQVKEITLAQSTKYVSAYLTIHTVNDSKKTVESFKPFKGITNIKAIIWDGSAKGSKKIVELPAKTKIEVQSLKSNRYSFTYKGKIRWIDKVNVDQVFSDFVVETTSSLNVRSGPSVKGKIVGTLKKGTKVTIKSSKDGWYKIIHKGKAAYISSVYTKKVVVFKEFKVKVTNSLNVRSQASTNGKIVGILKVGTIVNVKASKNGWYTITFNNKRAFISKKYTGQIN
ncbi:SH3 domain-containing protein [Exiguobacterium sp. s130]|uniref:SH3 domain-containing protein n=1 Tax=Exiguobacterium sp. s130 TaxID=2751190 RepID=UPI001BE5C61D|nr:SH3 domain-containing protein [Exiguobacterium sp. s130]